MRRLIFNIGIILLLGTVPCVALAEQGPGIPEAFHGRTTGAVGERVSAVIDGAVVASTTIETGNVYGYAPHLFFLPDPDSTRQGATILFLIGTTSAQGTAVFTHGAITALDLLLPGTTLEVPATTTATTTTPSIPDDDTTSSTTIIIASSTPPASTGSTGGGGNSGGSSVPAASTSITHPAVPSSDTSVPSAGQPPVKTPSQLVDVSVLQVSAKDSENASERDAGEEESSSRALLTSFPLAAAAVLATNGMLEPFLMLLAYLGAGGFFLYALLYRYRLRPQGRG